MGDGRYPEPRCTGQLYGLYLLLGITRDVEARGQDAAMRKEMVNLPVSGLWRERERGRNFVALGVRAGSGGGRQAGRSKGACSAS